MAQPAAETPVPVPDTPPPVASSFVIPDGKGFASVLKNRSFLAIWSAQFTSQAAQNSVWYVLIFLISRLTGASALGTAGIIIMVQLPTVLFSSVSGVLVDRVNKRIILIGTNFLRAVAVVGYLIFIGYGEALYLITFFVAVVSQPFQPAEGATIPLLVRKPQLITANSLFQMTFMISQILGFILAPALLQFWGIKPTLFVLIGLFGYAAAILFLLPSVVDKSIAMPTHGIVQSSKLVWNDLLDGVRSILADRPLLFALIQITFAPTVLLLLAAIAPTYVETVLQTQKLNTMFFVLAPAGLGMGVGLFVLGHWGNRLKKERLVVVALLAMSVTIFALAAVPALSHQVWRPLSLLGFHPGHPLARTLVLIPISLLLGVEVSLINAPVQTIVQERAPENMRGRILAMQQTMTAAIAIPPLLMLAGVETAIGVQGALGLVGTVLFMVGLISVYGL